MVYVLNQNGRPLMPTKNHAKVRVLLKQGKAKVINKCPFTIQLLYSSTSYTREVDDTELTLGSSSDAEWLVGQYERMVEEYGIDHVELAA